MFPLMAPLFLCYNSTPLLSLLLLLHHLHRHNHRHQPLHHLPNSATSFLPYFPSGSHHFCPDRKIFIYSSKVDEDEIYRRKKRNVNNLEWGHKSASIISQLSQCFTSAMVGSRTWFGGILHRSGLRRNGSDKFFDYHLTPRQEQRLHRLQDRLQVPFDENHLGHQEALRALWHAAFPNVKLSGLISDQWKDMGWQGPNPSTDFRGCGLVSLENLLFFSRTYPVSFQRLLFKQDGRRAKWEYPFAAAGINITFMLIQMLDLFSEKPRCISGLNFIKMLEEDEEALDVLFCIAFEMMDAQWLAMRASYMQFNEVLQATRTQLERELSLDDVHSIHDLPAYNLLYK